MELFLEGAEAFGRPGLEPRWSPSAKEGIGTAYNTASRVWFTVSRGVITEVYFPTVDCPQVRDLQYLITDGESFFREERELFSTIEYLDAHSLGYRVVSEDEGNGYRLVKEIIADPHVACVLMRTRLEGEEEVLKRLRLYALLAPHMDMRGWGNSAARLTISGKTLLAARRGSYDLALGATIPFLKASCGFVGHSDGYTDVKRHLAMEWEFGHAVDGNVAVTGELDLSKGREFTLGLAFGFRRHGAITTLLESLGQPFEAQRSRFNEQWHRACGHDASLEKSSQDGGRLYRVSHSLLLAHEDKTYPGAMIAGLSIPWGEARGDEDGLGGYHLVWTRDLCQSAGGLMACDNLETPLRALIYLAASQLGHGGFYQNFWISGDPYWTGVQLDETAFPVILAWRLAKRRALKEFDCVPMARKAAGHLIRQGPATPQERWEENNGYSPSTLAAVIAGLICAADLLRGAGDADAAVFCEEYADFIESHLEEWLVTSQGSLLPGVPRHYIRLLPADPADQKPVDVPDRALIGLKNQPPGAPADFPAKDVVDAGFLELVRYGVRKPGDALIEDSLRVVDRVLKKETPYGPCWRRYNHDGYGQQGDGGPFLSWGKGRAWPLLTGERGHYELAAGRDPAPYLRAMERFASRGGMLPEQVWDEGDRPELGLYLGRPTGAAMPLLWAHAEYLKLLRSARDGAAVDLVPPVAERYVRGRGRKDLEVWKLNRRAESLSPGATLRIIAAAPFTLRWTSNAWAAAADLASRTSSVGLHYADLPTRHDQRGALVFTFYWPQEARWEGRDFTVALRAR